MIATSKPPFILIVEPSAGEMDNVCVALLRQGHQFGFVRTCEDALKVIAIDLYNFVIAKYEQFASATAEFDWQLKRVKSYPQMIFTYQKGLVLPRNKSACLWLSEPFEMTDLLELISWESVNASSQRCRVRMQGAVG